MNDEHQMPPSSQGEQDASEAWRDIVSQVEALGDAMGRWARAAADDPVNRARAAELKEHMRAMADSIGHAVDDAASTDFGRSLKEAAVQAGESLKTAGERISEEMTPRISSALRGAAEKMHRAAERMERGEDDDAS